MDIGFTKTMKLLMLPLNNEGEILIRITNLADLFDG